MYLHWLLDKHSCGNTPVVAGDMHVYLTALLGSFQCRGRCARA